MRSLRREAETVRSTQKLQVDLSGVSVFLAMPVHRNLPIQTVHSLLETQSIANSIGLLCHIHFDIGCALVEVARSACVHNFLKMDYTKLFWIDSDMQWSTDTFLRMVGLSTRLDVICGSYPGKSEPLVFQLNVPGSVDMNEYGCIPVHSGGLGFCIIDRWIIKRLAAKAPLCKMPQGHQKGEPMRHLFRTDVQDGQIVGEDTNFFSDVRALGYEVWCDPTIHLGHIGSKAYEGSLYEHTFTKQVAAE
jgi:hypothetical protein